MTQRAGPGALSQRSSPAPRPGRNCRVRRPGAGASPFLVSYSIQSAAKDLDERDLDVLSARHPRAWGRVSEELLAALGRGSAEQAATWLTSVKADAAQWRRRVRLSAQNPKVVRTAFPHLLRERLAMNWR